MEKLTAVYKAVRGEMISRNPNLHREEEAQIFNNNCKAQLFSRLSDRAKKVEQVLRHVRGECKTWSTDTYERVKDAGGNVWKDKVNGREVKICTYGIVSENRTWYSLQVESITYFGAAGWKPTLDEIMEHYGLLGYILSHTLIQTEHGWMLDADRTLSIDDEYNKLVSL
jgi:hypothetical protein